MLICWSKPRLECSPRTAIQVYPREQWCHGWHNKYVGCAALLPEELKTRGRLIYVIRNPKDCCNSLHYFRGEAKDGWLGNENGPGSFDRFLSGGKLVRAAATASWPV